MSFVYSLKNCNIQLLYIWSRTRYKIKVQISGSAERHKTRDVNMASVWWSWGKQTTMNRPRRVAAMLPRHNGDRKWFHYTSSVARCGDIATTGPGRRQSTARYVIRVAWLAALGILIHNSPTSHMAYDIPYKTSRPAIAGNPRCKNITAKSVHLTSLYHMALTSTNDHLSVLRHYVCT